MYSQQRYFCGWIKGDRQEVYRFVTWSNGLCGISREILNAQRGAAAGGDERIRSHGHAVRAWGKPLLVERRLGR